MANTKYIRGISGRGFRVPNSAGDFVTLKEGVQALVELEDADTQDILSREKDNFVRVANNATTAVIKPLHRRGFRVKPVGGTVTISNAAPGVVTFTAHGLKANDAVVFTSSANDLPAPLAVNTVYYVKTVATANTFTLSATAGGAVIDTTDAGSGTHTIHPVTKNVGPDSDVKVDLNDGATKRFLKRNFGRYIVLATAGDQLQSIVGLRDAQNSFRVEDPTLTLASAGANNDLTFVPKTTDGEIVTVALIDPGTNETPISADVVGDTNIEVELDVTQNVQSSATPVQAGANNDLTYTAHATNYPGTAGDAITVAYVMPPDTNQIVPLSIDVTGTDIVVSLAVAADGSTVTTTGDLLKAAILADADASALVTVADAAANDGSGLLVAVAETSLTGGVDYAINSTAAEVLAEIEATPAAHALVTVTHEGTGAGVVELHAATALGADPEGLSRGEVVTNVDLTDSFNVGQLRRHFKAWVEN